MYRRRFNVKAKLTFFGHIWEDTMGWTMEFWKCTLKENERWVDRSADGDRRRKMWPDPWKPWDNVRRTEGDFVKPSEATSWREHACIKFGTHLPLCPTIAGSRCLLLNVWYDTRERFEGSSIALEGKSHVPRKFFWIDAWTLAAVARSDDDKADGSTLRNTIQAGMTQKNVVESLFHLVNCVLILRPDRKSVV